MAVQGEPGLIDYHFGTEGKSGGVARGAKGFINRRSLTLAGVILFVTVMLTVGIVTRKEATIKIAHSHTAAGRTLADGSRVTFFTAWINNRGLKSHTYELNAEDIFSDSPLILKGTHRNITLEAGGNRKVDIAIVSEQATALRTAQIYLLQDGKTVADAIRFVNQVAPPSATLITSTYYAHNDHLGRVSK